MTLMNDPNTPWHYSEGVLFKAGGTPRTIVNPANLKPEGRIAVRSGGEVAFVS